MFKKVICAILACLLAILALPACTLDEDKANIKIVCTVFPLYDWVCSIVGDSENVEILWLSDNGTDLHSYQPTAEDMVNIASADLTVCVGGVSDTWIRDAVKNSSEGELLSLSETEGVTVRYVSAESGHHHEDGHYHETDEHLWLSLKNAAVCVEALCQKICQLDGERAETYRANTDAYLNKLRELDGRFAQAAAEAQAPRLLFADRFPFVYLTEDYGIDYAAAFSGCSTDTDADFSTVIRLAKTADQWKLRYIMITESSDGALAEAVIRATEQKNQTVEKMNSLQGVRRQDEEAGLTYLSAMEENLTVLRRVLDIETKE